MARIRVFDWWINHHDDDSRKYGKRIGKDGDTVVFRSNRRLICDLETGNHISLMIWYVDLIPFSCITGIHRFVKGNWIEKSGGKKVEMAKPGLRITVPKFDNSELIVSYSRTLIGRCMNPPKQDMKILLFMLPRIWNVEGRVAGVDLGLGRFQFNFDLEEDIVEVVKNEPFFFDHWMLSLVRWKPVPEPNYPSRIIFWVRVLDIPLQFRAAPIFQCVGEALGQIRGPIDLVGGRVRVEIDAFKPLIFSVAFEFEGGVEILATLRYEKLFGFCKECFRLTHDISRCPNLHKEDPVQLKGESMETQGGSATSYKAAVASDSRQFEVSRDGQQGRYQGPRGGDKGKGVTRNKHVPYKNEDSYHPYKDRFSKGNGKGSLSHGRYGSYGERKKGLQTRGTQQPRVDNGERDPIIPEKLMLDAFKGVLRSPVKETALVQPSSGYGSTSKACKSLFSRKQWRL
ncbi:hypothetical protein Bca4012_020319 [Brassica carinata]